MVVFPFYYLYLINLLPYTRTSNAVQDLDTHFVYTTPSTAYILIVPLVPYTYV